MFNLNLKINSKHKIKKSLLVAAVIAGVGVSLCDYVYNLDLTHYDYISHDDQSKKIDAGSKSLITFNESKTETKVKAEILNSQYAHEQYTDLTPVLLDTHFLKIDLDNLTHLNSTESLDPDNFVLKTATGALIKPSLVKDDGTMCTTYCKNEQTLIFNVSDNTEIKSLSYRYNNVLKQLKFDYSYQNESKTDFDSFKQSKKNLIDIVKFLWICNGIFWGFMTFSKLKKKEKDNDDNNNNNNNVNDEGLDKSIFL